MGWIVGRSLRLDFLAAAAEMRVCEPVIVEGTAPKKNPSESGRSKASGGFRQKPGHDLIL